MNHRRRPLRIDAIDQRKMEKADPFADVQLSKIVKELSFIRISIDEITMETPNPFIQKLSAADELNGFFLEYSFPCLDAVSKALKSTVRLPSKTATATSIGFKHKRVVLLSMHPDQIVHWQNANFTIHLLIGYISSGKYTIRPLAKCTIQLNELLLAPYLIHRDFEFEGCEFEGSALIKLDLGCRNKILMEKLEALRDDRSLDDETFVVRDRHRPLARRTRSRSSSSRCQSAHSHRSPSTSRKNSEEYENRIPNQNHIVEIGEVNRKRHGAERVDNNHYNVHRPYSARSSASVPLYDRNLAASSSSLGSDSVFRTEVPRNRVPITVDQYSSAADIGIERNEIWNTGRNAGSRSSSTTTEEVKYEGRCYLQLTVHGAEGLPPVEDECGRLVSPNAYISVLGRDGELRSNVIPNSRSPSWNWTARFALSSERRNLVIKVVHRSTTSEVGIGFVFLSLPIATTRKAVFELTNTTGTSKFTSSVPIVVLSIEKVRDLDQEDYGSSRRSASSRTSSIRRHQSTQSSPTVPAPRMDSPIFESSEVIAERMRRDVEELDTMVRRFRI